MSVGDKTPGALLFFVPVKCGMASPNPQKSMAKSTYVREGDSSGVEKKWCRNE